MTYKTWEYWLITSITLFVVLFFIGTLEGSRNIKSFPYLISISFINVTICSIVGLKRNNKIKKQIR